MKTPSYASVAATLALVLAASGTAYAAGIPKNSVTSKQIKNDSVTGKDIKESTLDIVPRANSAASATTATSATSAGTAASANNANALGGAPASSFARSGLGVSGPAEVLPLQLTVPGWGTFRLSCELHVLNSTIDDDVSFGATVSGAGAVTRRSATIVTQARGATTATTALFAANVADGATTDYAPSDAVLSADLMVETADGAHALRVEARGQDDITTLGCAGFIEAQVLR
ncbi:hypothetical protein G5V58_00345 [Nocardioides anomalus]|uniref:Uncharacterized protein n=1 Tax=Nocardioides anomalus TaxID=2712223 RepID=A0A6G6W8J0_9ACTN|nr:hypothetical protein [Nocardioides anomalus]QIG41425.1 hypothetical protein G5V58_00345 [Nocardioides anomalus]